MISKGSGAIRIDITYMIYEVVPNYWTTGLDRVWLQFGRDLTLRIKGVIHGQSAQAAQCTSQCKGRDRGRPRTEDDQPAREWVEHLGKRVRVWISDKQDAFLKGIATEFPGVPHRYCENHFLRDLAKPVLEMDSHAKVRMRRKVRGLRHLEREVLNERRRQTPEREEGAGDRDASAEPSDLSEDAGAVVLDYCAAVRGILNDNHGGPLQEVSPLPAGRTRSQIPRLVLAFFRVID